ncbi:mRNA poyadenylation and turnover [Scheffersomyces stipitis CBS 6054]|uniref:RING-type E3 ubiquitin transferase n=1 Tax=Scheffersomyces stipitis (strain ATCC 58785 / CBS 6054 / NBRC 10063 / NRRL Y-11545) TaxID=322104 RepID=A3LY51_PICST|nr:mRNA poyadenylation and turnover [Scheffersomyces stipitis CBS 6054]ABN67574.2 mRNA poyadenylation and turnover [Scheffersomyces stipitis CBS 6054]
MEVNTCRICRGEATRTQPLLHPCKCRGSIKYIHQECLLEWLRHSNKSSEKCDICNTQYKFRIIYDPEMPSRIPFLLVWFKLIQILSSGAIKSVSIALYINCLVLQVPLYWKFAGRIYTWAIDGQLPAKNPTFLSALLFGEYDIRSYIESAASALDTGFEVSSFQLSLLKLRKFFEYTYFSGIRYIFIAIAVHIALFIEHEWVIRDEGFQKLLLRKIGSEPSAKLVDLLQQTLHAQRGDGNNNNEEATANLERLETLARAIRDLQDENINNNNNNNEALRNAINARNIFNDDVNIGEADDEDDLSEGEDDDEWFQQDIDHDEMDAEVAALAEANADGGGGFGDLLELFGINLNIKTPIFLMFVSDFVISAYLFLIYLIPHMLGNLFFSVAGMGIRLVNSSVIRSLISPMRFPASNIYINLFEAEHPHYSLAERIILLTIGYAIIAFGIYRFMKVLVKGKKPVMGTPRKIYKILFEVSSTAKVFFIFSIEIFFFPVYCGWLLDFCVAPLVLPQFTRKSPSGVDTFVVLVSSYYDSLQETYLRVLMYWSSGTLYMLLFALFVGMVRTNILRPGVLFFIRSPDDPNARLIHDALVKPLMLQLSRIYLSAKVYTGFIIIGIGGVTWGLRHILSTTKGTIFLPIQSSSVFFDIILCVLATRSLVSQQWALEYCQLYWTRVFEISCHKLRLSHFILGKPISQERGYTVYRNIFQTIMATAQPDFTSPVSYRQAQEIFKSNPNVNACFVPDGNYIRAPDSDTVSRKFVKKLFVSVTKDDKLLTAAEINTAPSAYETPSSEAEDELSTDNSYTIVYRPPHFKMRCLALICMLWVFAVIITMAVTFGALLSGRMILIVASYTADSKLYDAMVKRQYRFDIPCLAIGLLLEFTLLYQFDQGRPQQQLGNQRNAGNEFRFDQFQERFRKELTYVCVIGSFLLWALWVQGVHILCVDRPIRFLFNTPDGPFIVDKFSIPVHFLVSFWTFLPFIYYVMNSTRFVRIENNNDGEFDIARILSACGFYQALINIAIVVVPTASLNFYLSYLGKPADDSRRIYMFPLAYFFFIVAKSIHEAYRFYSRVNDQVKNERYVRGRAIENVEISDNEQ